MLLRFVDPTPLPAPLSFHVTPFSSLHPLHSPPSPLLFTFLLIILPVLYFHFLLVIFLPLPILLQLLLPNSLTLTPFPLSFNSIPLPPVTSPSPNHVPYLTLHTPLHAGHMEGVVMRGHCNDELWGLASHPTQPLYCTAG